MDLQKVDPREIKVPEVRVTAQFDDDLYQQFKQSIKQVGTIAPPIVYQVEGDLVLCDGLHRIQEAIEAGQTEIDVVVIPGDMADVLTKNIFLDHLRGKTPVSQMVKVIGSLYSEFNLDPDLIGEKTGLTRNYIEKLIKISQASPSVQDALDQGVLGVGHAFELSRLPFAIQQEEVIAKHQVWRFTIPELKEQVDGVLREMEMIKEEPPSDAPGAPLTPRQYACEGCKEPAESRYLRPVLLCPDCFGHVYRLAKQREPAVEKVEKEGDTP